MSVVAIVFGATPFIFLQLLGLVIVGLYPALSNYIPFRSYLTSELAPPSTNPKLERCLMDYTYTLYKNDEPQIRKAIAEAKTFQTRCSAIEATVNK